MGMSTQRIYAARREELVAAKMAPCAADITWPGASRSRSEACATGPRDERRAQHVGCVSGAQAAPCKLHSAECPEAGRGSQRPRGVLTRGTVRVQCPVATLGHQGSGYTPSLCPKPAGALSVRNGAEWCRMGMAVGQLCGRCAPGLKCPRPRRCSGRGSPTARATPRADADDRRDDDTPPAPDLGTPQTRA